jgi:hypothetical protein
MMYKLFIGVPFVLKIGEIAAQVAIELDLVDFVQLVTDQFVDFRVVDRSRCVLE